MVGLLIEKGADVNLKGEAWYGPLHVAAANGHTQVVKVLLANGADVNIFHHDKPLHYAAMNGHIEVAEILLARGADINAKGTDEYTALGTAVVNRQVEMVKFLLSKRADPNARAIYGRTPLYITYERGDVDMGRILLEHGADATLEYDGRTIPQSFVQQLRE